VQEELLMADNLGSFKVFCQGGLNTSRDVLSQGETQPGSAISLINYEPAVTGGYRRLVAIVTTMVQYQVLVVF
jgi:hypothetical protein